MAKSLARFAKGRRLAGGLPATQLPLLIVLSGILIAAAWPGLAKDHDVVSNEFVELDIPEQPLAAALERFMALSNVTIVVDSAIIGASRSNAVRGAFSPDGALQSLLEGTGLDSRHIGPGAYTLVPLPQSAEARPRLPRFADYAAAVQRAVIATLCRRDDTIPDRYRAVIRLWLRPEGKAMRGELAISTGSPSRDTAITDTLQRVDVGMPVPAGLPQPIKLAILPRATDGAACVADHALVQSTPQSGR
jgi:hypothetical protein